MIISEKCEYENLSRYSHKTIIVECDFKASEKCRLQYTNQYRHVLDFRENNNGKDICLFCNRFLNFCGNKNPNAKDGRFPDDYFDNVDTEIKAYLLGWIASDGSISKWAETISIGIHIKDKEIIEDIIKITGYGKLKINIVKQRAYLNIHSKQIKNKVCEIFNIKPGKKSHLVNFPKFKSDELTWHFLRGYFDGDGYVQGLNAKETSPRCGIASNSQSMLDGIVGFTKIKSYEGKSAIVWNGNNALDFLAKLYENSNIKLKRKYDLYLAWSNWVPSLAGARGKELNFTWNKSDARAIKPFKERASDSGFDLTIIDIWKQSGDVIYYETGIKIKPEYGWYFDLVPRSSLVKTGYILANSIGIIDRTYVGSIKVPLIKIDKNKPDLELPGRYIQIIPRPIIHIEWREGDVDDTSRGDGGFGSTGR